MTEKRCPPNIGEHLNYLISILPRLLIPYYSEASAFPAKALLAVSRRGIRKVQGLSKDQKDSAFDPLRLLKVFGHAIEGNVFHPFLVLITKH